MLFISSVSEKPTTASPSSYRHREELIKSACYSKCLWHGGNFRRIQRITLVQLIYPISNTPCLYRTWCTKKRLTQIKANLLILFTIKFFLFPKGYFSLECRSNCNNKSAFPSLFMRHVSITDVVSTLPSFLVLYSVAHTSTQFCFLSVL